MKTRLIALSLLTASLSAVAQADGMQAGLWEIRNRTTVDGQALPDLQELMAQVPPEMRAQMEGMMASQGVGVQGNAVRLCLSEASARRNEVPIETQEDCTVNRQAKGPGHWTLTLQCSNPPQQGEGEIRLSADGRQWQTRMTLRSQAHGQPQVTRIDSEGRWLGADCGRLQAQ